MEPLKPETMRELFLQAVDAAGKAPEILEQEFKEFETLFAERFYSEDGSLAPDRHARLVELANKFFPTLTAK